MNKVQALLLLLEIGDECDMADKCTRCGFYNVTDHIEGCVFDRLANQINPCDFREALSK